MVGNSNDNLGRLPRRLHRIKTISRRNARLALTLLTQLELRAKEAHQNQHQLQLDALYQRYLIKERLSEAHQLIDELHNGLSLAAIYHLPVQASRFLEALGRIHYTSGNYKEAVHYWIDCIDACTLNQDHHSLIEARIGLGQVYDAIGDWHSGTRFLLDAGTLLQEIDDPYLHSKQAINLAVNQQHLGQQEYATSLLRAAITQAERGGIIEYVAEAHWHLGKISIAQSAYTQAHHELTAALQMATACSYRWLQGAAKMSLAALLEIQSNTESTESTRTSTSTSKEFTQRAIDAYLVSLQDANQVNATAQQIQCCAALSRLYEKQGEIGAALDYARLQLRHKETLTTINNADRFKELREVDLSQKPPVELLLDLSINRQADNNFTATSIQAITEVASKILRVDLICVWLLESSCNPLICHSVRSPVGLNFSVGDEFIDPDDSAYLQLLSTSRHPIVAHDIHLHPCVTEVLSLYGKTGLQSLMEIPLQMHGKFIGVVSFGLCHQHRNWSREDVLFGSHIASLLQQNLVHSELTAALANVKTEAENRVKAELALQQSYDRLKERSADMLKLSVIGRELTATLNMEQAFERVYKQVTAKLDAFVFGIGIYDHRSQEISMVYLIEDSQRQPNIIFKMSEHSRPAVWCVREKRELVVAVRSELEAYVGPLLPVLFGRGMQSLIYMPLMVSGEVIGCITAQSPTQHAFRPDQVEFLTVLASYTAIAVSNSIAHSELSTAHRRTQETQQQMVLQEKMAGLGTLTAGVAHEINNPTNFAHVAAQNLRVDIEEFKEFIHQLIEEDEDPEVLKAFSTRFDKLTEHVTTMLNGTERIKGIVKDLRNFTRLGDADKKVAKMSECLISTINLVRTSWQEQVNFILDLKEDPEINCWPALLNQVFMNLMVNACQAIAEKQASAQQYQEGREGREGQDGKAGKTDKLNLYIALKIDQTNLLITFQDEGIGMSKETQHHAMEPFFTTKEVGAGTGLGLSIAYGIVEKHGGNLSFTSDFGVGSCFTISLPI